MKNMKKILALVVAALMIAASVSALAETTAPAWAGMLDTKISVTGLTDGDSVTFYKVLKYDQNAVATKSWSVADGFTLSNDEISAILTSGITSTIAGKIGKQTASATGTGVVKYGPLTAASGKVEKADPEAGLYVAIITPAANTDNTYNPVFVGADYYTNTDPNKSNTWAVSASTSYADNAMAKKSTVTLEKTGTDRKTVDTNNKETVAVGDTIDFTVTTTIPGFADNYTNPVFKLSDKMSSGLTYTAGSVTVTVPAGLTKGNEYTVNETKAENGNNDYVLSFTAEYLKTVKTATAVTVTYTAVVDSDALQSVNPEDNTVTLNYSNSPDDTEGHGIKRDKTNHYSFDIDANLFGEENYEATEVVKVGVDKDGNEITETRQLSNQHWVGALENAEFKLYFDNNGAKGAAYTNKYYNANSVFVSDANGTLKLKDSEIQGIRGLDAGVYWLEEIKAPAGYVKLQDAVKIEIKVVTEEVTYTETEKINGVDVEVTYKADALKSYSVEIGGVETANYTMQNKDDGTHAHIKASKGDTVVGGTDSGSGKPSADKKGKLQNTQGVELPSTGGMGTTILYVGGSILVILAAVLLITKRRMNAND